MDYLANAEMILWPPVADDYSFDIPDYDGSLDLTTESRSEEKGDLLYQVAETYPVTSEEKINWQEQIRMIHLRSHLNKLLETVTQAQYLADTTREELKKCHCQIEQHEDERDQLCMEIETKQSEGNRSAVQRLKAAFKRVCTEIEAEKTLEGVIRDKLEQAQYELALAEVERGKFILAEDDLLQKENQLANNKAHQAAIRLHKEELLTRQALITKSNDKRKWEDALNDAERRHIHAIEEAEKSHERANKYLSKTLEKLKKRQQEEQDRYNADMSRKMDMLLKLKKDIANNRENLRVIRARNVGIERGKMLKEQEEMNKILAEGGNPEQMMLIKKRKNEMEKKKQQFEAEQKLKKSMVLEKIIREEENIKKKLQQQPYLFDDPEREKTLRVGLVKKKLPMALLECLAADVCKPADVDKVDDEKHKETQEGSVASSDSFCVSEDYRKMLKKLSIDMKQLSAPIQEVPTPNVIPKTNKNKNKEDTEDEYPVMDIADVDDLDDETTPSEEETVLEDNQEEESEEMEDIAYFQTAKFSLVADEKGEESVEDEEEEEMQIDLAKPEFEGLWDKETKSYKSIKYTDDLSAKPVNGSKMEKEILKKTLEKTREGIIKPQIAAGKQFSGRPFYSKPSVLHFKDFVVGKTYKKKAILTNVSYSVNHIRFLEVSDGLKDFIKINFEPPGQMSAGMSCEMTVMFKPLLNVDLEGEVHFLTQTGAFHVPLVCSTRRCDLSVDTSVVQFGTSVIGETLKRSFVLTNRGSLGTSFQFVKGIEMKIEQIDAETNQDQTIAEVGVSMISKQSSIENIGSGVSLTHIQQELIPERESKSREMIHASDMFATPTEFESDPVRRLSSKGVPLKEIASTPQTPGVVNQASGMTVLSDVRKMSMAVEGNDVATDVVKSAMVTEADKNDTNETAFIDEPLPESTVKSDHELGNVILEESKSCLVLTEEEDVSSLDGMTTGPLVAGELGPYSSVQLEIIWQPTLTGDVKTEFTIFFTDPQTEPISILAMASAIDVPVWLDRQTVDLKICMFDRLYQDTIVINNRATTSLKLQFDICKELRDHLELLPKTGFIQAHSQFSAQLKFLPRQSLFQEAAKFFDPDTGVLEAPMTVRVAGQVTPVCFTVQAVVTTSDLEFGVCDLDFGCCTIHESVKQTFQLTNKSILSQQFGFVGLPDCLEVQPNDGFGTLLPLETLTLDVIFSPKAAKEYKMNLLCKTLINRDFSISCHGVGVLTPLELSEQVINFRATSVYDTSTATLYVINHHTSANEYTHPVPRVGVGEIFPVGPTCFEFKVPKDAPITISPSVGTLLPGQKIQLEVRFSPSLDSDDIRLEALKIKARLQTDKEEQEREETEKLKQESDTLMSESVIESKSRKGNKRADINVNNLATVDINVNNLATDDINVDNLATNDINVDKVATDYDTLQDEQVDEINLHTIDNIDNFKHETKLQNVNEPASSFQENNNMPVFLEHVSQDTPYEPDYEARFVNDMCVPIVEPNSNISRIAFKKSVSCQAKTRDEISKKSPAMPKVPHQKSALIVTGKKILTKLQVDLENRISNHNDRKSEKKGTNEDEKESEVIQKNVSVKHIQLPGKKNACAREKTKMNMCKMNTTDSIPYPEDQNNNKDDEKESNDSGVTSNIRLGERPEKSRPGSKTEFNTRVATPVNEDSDDGDVVRTTLMGKKKSSAATKLSVSRSRSKPSVTSTTSSSYPETPGSDADSLIIDSSQHRAAITSLLRQFKGHFQSVSVPCYIASGQAGDPGKLNYSIHNTLYLEVHCPAVRPQIMVISDEGRHSIDFGSISVGQTCSKSVTVQNICEKQLKLKATLLDPAGPFEIRNAFRDLLPGATHTILLTFTPDQSQIFQENLGIKTLNSTLHLTLKGCGVTPLVSMNIEDAVLDMKAVLAGEFVEKLFTVENLSVLPIEFIITQDSSSHLRHIKAQNIAPFLGKLEPHRTKNYVGPQNKSGRTVFDIVPATGTIDAGETKEIMVTFAPDHESDLFSDGVRIQLFSQEESHFFQVIGQGKSQIMYLEGCDILQTPLISLACLPKFVEDDDATGPLLVSPPVLITMETTMNREFFEPCTKQIYMGCVQAMTGVPRRAGEFSVDGLQGQLQKCFTIQPNKGTVEADSKKAIVFTCLPPTDTDPNTVLEETVTLTLKGDAITEQIPVVIRARIVQSR